VALLGVVLKIIRLAGHLTTTNMELKRIIIEWNQNLSSVCFESNWAKEIMGVMGCKIWYDLWVHKAQIFQVVLIIAM